MKKPASKPAEQAVSKGPKAKRTGAENAFFRPFEQLAARPKNKKPKTPKEPAAPPAPAPKPAEPKALAPSDHLQHSEMESFALYMAGVRALDKKGAARVPRSLHAPEPESPVKQASGAPPPPLPDLDAPARAALRSLVAEGLRFETIDDGKQLEGRRIDTDPRELRRLRKGMHAIDGKLDLHGLDAASARAAVTAFIRKRRAEGDRVIALIHGKGIHTPGGTGVLRGEIGAWLTDAANAEKVACFASAPDDLGGFGVLLVLLSR